MEAESITILDGSERICLNTGAFVISGSIPVFKILAHVIIVNVLTTTINNPEKNGKMILIDLGFFV